MAKLETCNFFCIFCVGSFFENSCFFRKLLSAVSDSTNIPVDSALQMKIHNVFKFWQWKQRNYLSDFSDHDNLIVQINDYGNFTKLSSKCCLYTKSVAKAYSVHLWQDIATNEYLIDGRSTIATVS